MSEWMNEWMNEGTNERKNEWMNETLFDISNGNRAKSIYLKLTIDATISVCLKEFSALQR